MVPNRNWPSANPARVRRITEIRQKFTQVLVRSLNRTFGDLENLQLGWRLDRQQKRTYIDLNVNARRSSQLAERVSQLADQTTQFGGFLLNGAVLKANWLGQVVSEDAAAYAAVVDAVRDKALQSLDTASGSSEEKAILKELTQVYDVLRATTASGRSDGALSLRIDDFRLTLVVGSYVADGKQLEKVLKPLGQFLQQNRPAFASLKLDADTAGDVSFHALPLPAPNGNDARSFIKCSATNWI